MLAKPGKSTLLRTLLSAGIGAGAVAISAPAEAEDLTAGAVIEQMEPGDQFPFVSGIVEGLAYARYQSDGHTEGRSCIYRWFYQEHGTYETILSAFTQFPEYFPAAVVGAMATRGCG